LITQKTIVFVFLLSLSAISYAKDLGVVGQIYSIKETDLLEFIQKRVNVMQQNGEWNKLQDRWRDNVSKHTDRPLAVSKIRKTIAAKLWKYDPSISVPYDLKDSEGKVFAEAGTRVNPLSFRSLHTALVFYDADDNEQIDWVKKINKKYAGKTKLILVNGSVSQQEKIFHQPIYFDQQGRLTTIFHITQVPAVVYQDGMDLAIAEVIP
jgi:conjugal transfer pilus assembly protein TraW